MSDEKQETRADIVREMRKLGELDEKSTDKIPRSLMGLGLRTYADRLEAAAKREKSEAEANALFVGGVVEASRHQPVGNAAAMRVALENLVYNIELRASVFDIFSIVDRKAWMDAKAALSAPPRNCDLYATATEALKAQDVAFNEDNFKNGECRLGCPGCDDGLINCKILWLFAPAAERKGEN